MKKVVLFLSLLLPLCLAAFDNAERDPTISLEVFCIVYHHTWDNGVCYVESDTYFYPIGIQLYIDANERLVIRGSLEFGKNWSDWDYVGVTNAGVIYVSGSLRNHTHLLILEGGVLAVTGHLDNHGAGGGGDGIITNYGEIYNAGNLINSWDVSPREWWGSGILNNEDQASIYNLGVIEAWMDFYNNGIIYHCPGSTASQVGGTNIYLDTCDWIIPMPLKNYLPMVSMN